MSLRALIAESETEYKYRVYSTAPIHGATELAAIRVGLAGRMARDITPAGILPWMGTKSDRFPEVSMKPVYVVELVTGLPLNHDTAIRELSFALNVAQEKIQIEGENATLETPKDKNPPYQKDGITPGFLSKDMKEETPLKALNSLLGDLADGKGHLARDEKEVKKVYEGYAVTQIEAEAMLDTDLPRGYYVVEQISESKFDIIGPLPEVPSNYALDFDRAQSLTEGVLREMNYSTARHFSVRVQNTDNGDEYPVLVPAGAGESEDDLRNKAVQMVSTKYSIPSAQLIALAPDHANKVPTRSASMQAAV